jgi:hypothetical protein
LFSQLLSGLKVVWPILSALLTLIVGLGFIVGMIEGWSLDESIYFAFISGMTIGFGDLVPTGLLTRALTIRIGFCGLLLTALLAAVAVKALGVITQQSEDIP